MNFQELPLAELRKIAQEKYGFTKSNLSVSRKKLIEHMKSAEENEETHRAIARVAKNYGNHHEKQEENH